MTKDDKYIHFNDKEIDGLDLVPPKPTPAPPGYEPQYIRFDDPKQGGVERLWLIVGRTKKTFVVQHAKIGRRKLGVFPVMNVRQARQMAREWLLEMDKGNDPAEKPPELAWQSLTLQQAFDEFMAAGSHAESTVELYRRYVMGKSLAAWRGLKLFKGDGKHNITRAGCEQKHIDIRDTIRREKCEKKGLAELPKTDFAGHSPANLAMKVIEAVWGYLEDKYKDQGFPMNLNPVTGMTMFFVPVRKGRVKNEDLPGWWKATETVGRVGKPDPIMRDMLRFMLLTSLRNEDCCGIKWEDIDWDKKKIFRGDPKGGLFAEFDLPLSDAAIAILRGRERGNKTDLQTNADKKIGKEYDKTDYVFPIHKADGSIGCRHKIKKPKALQRFGIVHDLRRTFRTAARNAEVEISVSTRLTNHRSDTDSDGKFGKSTGRTHDDYDDRKWKELADGMQAITNYLLGKIGVAVENGAFVEREVKPDDAKTAENERLKEEIERLKAANQPPATVARQPLADDPQVLFKQMAEIQAKLASIMQSERKSA
jgi:integrase